VLPVGEIKMYIHVAPHKRTHPALTPASEDLPIPDGWKAELTYICVVHKTNGKKVTCTVIKFICFMVQYIRNLCQMGVT